LELQLHFGSFFESIKAILLLWVKTLLQRQTFEFKMQKRGASLHRQFFTTDIKDKKFKISSLFKSVITPLFF